jgi:microcystin-dependent protein
MATPFMGELKLFPIAFAPKGWAECNGQFLPINQNQALFSLLGTNYGGDGRTTFALPDLRGRVPMHGATLPVGAKVGVEAVTLSQAQMPAHTHLVSADSTTAPDADGNVPLPGRRLAASSPGSLYGAPRNLAPMDPGFVTTVGGSQPHTNMQPYLALRWCIATQGIFPSRN